MLVILLFSTVFSSRRECPEAIYPDVVEMSECSLLSIPQNYQQQQFCFIIAIKSMDSQYSFSISFIIIS